MAEAEAEVAAAERTAAAAALHAAQLAASAGLDYAAPAGVAVDLSGIEKARACHILLCVLGPCCVGRPGLCRAGGRTGGPERH